MRKLERILFPTDFSRCADQALDVALDLTQRNSAELHLLHALVLHHYDPETSAERLDDLEDRILARWQADASERLAAVAANRTKDLMVTAVEKRGVSAAAAILEYERDVKADLVVMGTHGRHGLGHLLLGSVAEEVVRFASCPVLTVREKSEAQLWSDTERILVPVDFSDHSLRALRIAKHVAAMFDAHIDLLHVIEQALHPSFYTAGNSSLAQYAPDLVQRCGENLIAFAAEAQGPEVSIDVRVIDGRANSEIVGFAERNASDLIIMASHGLTGLQRFLIGSIAQKVVRRAPCPVLTLRAFGRSWLD